MRHRVFIPHPSILTGPLDQAAVFADEPSEPQLEYFAKDDDSAVLTHSFQVRNEEAGTWFEAFVDAHTGELVSVTDFVAKASVGTCFT